MHYGFDYHETVNKNHGRLEIRQCWTIAEEVKQLKEQPGNDMSVGGAVLAATFMQLDLIDEYGLYVHPVILGGGKPMLGSLQDKITLQLLETRTFGSGVVLLRYQRAAERR